jgi:hypothetical protein
MPPQGALRGIGRRLARGTGFDWENSKVAVNDCNRQIR